MQRCLILALLCSAAAATLVSLNLDTSDGRYSFSTAAGVILYGLECKIQMNRTTL